MQRLDFTLPNFLRVAWVSPEARALWQPRIERMQAAWRLVEQESVIRGIRACAILTVGPSTLPAVSGYLVERDAHLIVLSLSAATPGVYQSSVTPPMAGAPYEFRVAIGSASSLRSFHAAWSDNSDEGIGELLGYPACCRKFFRETWSGLGLRDPTWPMAGGKVGAGESRQRIELSAIPAANVLARFVGVRAVPHLPCSFACDASGQLGERLLGLGEALGLYEEMAWLREMLSWSYEWSALHGIAEIRSPILKVATPCDATPIKYVVQLRGSTYPEAGATGNRFPYRLRRRPNEDIV